MLILIKSHIIVSRFTILCKIKSNAYRLNKKNFNSCIIFQEIQGHNLKIQKIFKASMIFIKIPKQFKNFQDEYKYCH